MSLPALPKLPAVATPQNKLLPKLPDVPAVGIPALPNSDTVPNLVKSMTSKSTAADNATVTLSPNGGSGISASVKVKGLSVSGKAKGLDPSKRYISLYSGSISTPQAGQTLTCADLRTAALPQMWGLAPEWKVNSDGSGTLNVTAPRTLSQGVYTMSIREVPSTGMSDPYVGFNPVTYPVRACGAVR